ncbi:MAG: hypothetical protein J7604_16255 [Sporocytophaga sp.]|uniref:hypothetical protein n=1 Tax=Sporocytophaga sp. TaxID=2231183 RepID=UPI001B14353E|nr:hypothetical protein [Sporocytophaga sp.]MBO9701760.1 hypothetical protein [Sporocytophaga sp.]
MRIFILIYIFSFAFTINAIGQESNEDTLNYEDQRVPETWGFIDPGKGFQVAKTKYGTINISLYILARYINQLPGVQSFTDHLGVTHKIDPRNDIQLHRILGNISGFIYLPKLSYVVTLWTVNSTNQVAIVGALGYSFNKSLNFFSGISGNAGTRSMLGSHPYWLGGDRVMADEFFRPGFTSGVWVNGEILPKIFYKVMLGNNLSQLGINAVQITRKLTPSASIWWMPTTGEFGPRGAYGDYEDHQKLATRIGGCFTFSRENRYNDLNEKSPDNTQIRNSDGLLLFQTGSLAKDVTVMDANYKLFSADAGIKYKGLFLQTEYFFRTLSKFNADGPLPVSSIFDNGFYIQAGYMVLPKKLEAYTATSQIFGQFRNSHEFLAGTNFYPANTRNFRVNAQLIKVFKSPTGSTFGYYLAGQTGYILSFASSLFF